MRFLKVVWTHLQARQKSLLSIFIPTELIQCAPEVIVGDSRVRLDLQRIAKHRLGVLELAQPIERDHAIEHRLVSFGINLESRFEGVVSMVNLVQPQVKNTELIVSAHEGGILIDSEF